MLKGAHAITQEAVPDESAKDDLMESLSKGNFTMRILYDQLANIQKMGPVGQVLGMIPGMANSGFDKVRLITSRFGRSSQRAGTLMVLLGASG